MGHTLPGAKYRSLRNPSLYEKLRAAGRSKQSSARISNAQAKRKKKRRRRFSGTGGVRGPAFNPRTGGVGF